MLEGHQTQDIRKSVTEQNRNDFAVTRQVVVEVHRRLERVEYHGPRYSADETARERNSAAEFLIDRWAGITHSGAMSFQARIDQDIKAAMLARESAKLGVLRMLKSALLNAAIEKHGAGGVLEDAEALAIVRKEVKKRQDSVESFEKGGRPEMASAERAEIVLLEAYLPQALTPEELAAVVAASIAEAGATTKQQMGAVMKVANAKAAGRADGRALSAEVARQLGG